MNQEELDAQARTLSQIRALVPDDAAIYGDNADEYMFTDEIILTMYNGSGRTSILRTAGMLMIAVGNSEALISKVIRTNDLSTNGASLQASWLASGRYYVDLATKEDEQFFQLLPGKSTRNIAEEIVGWELGDYGSYWVHDRFDPSW